MRLGSCSLCVGFPAVPSGSEGFGCLALQGPSVCPLETRKCPQRSRVAAIAVASGMCGICRMTSCPSWPHSQPDHQSYSLQHRADICSVAAVAAIVRLGSGMRGNLSLEFRNWFKRRSFQVFSSSAIPES